MSTVTIGGLALDVASSTSLRTVTLLTGWLDATPVRPGVQPKAQQDGDWDATGTSGSRVIGVAGFAEESSASAAETFARQLTALRPQSVYAVVVTTAAGELSASARVTVGAVLDWIGDRAFEYTLTLTAPDSLLYGAPTYGTASLGSATPGAGRVWPRVWPTNWGIAPGVTPGSVFPALVNAGTAAYWPRMRIDGPVLNPVVTLQETGAWVRFNGELTTGQWLDWDMANRRVLLQGQVSVRHLVTSSGDWLAVPVGGAAVSWTADTADPAALLSVWGYERAVS